MLELLLQRMKEKVADGKTNPIGYGGGSMVGVPMAEADLMRSPCRALRWMYDNSPFEFETYVRLTHSQGHQGLIVRSKDTGKVLRTVEVIMGGGEDADPKNQIYRNNRRIIVEALRIIQEKLDAGGW